MTTDLVVEPGPFRWRFAQVRAATLVALRVVDTVAGIEDDLFWAQVTAGAPDLGGIFVDLGRSKGVLVRLPRRLRKPMPVVGTSMIVQGVRDARPGKPGRASSMVRLVGGLVAYHPGAADAAAPLSEGLDRATSRALRRRGRELFGAQPLALSASALDMPDADIHADAAWVQALWAQAVERSAGRTGPCSLVSEDERLALAVRALSPGTARIWCPAPLVLRVRRLVRLAGLELVVEPSTDPWTEVGLEAGLAAVRSAIVPLPGGGELVIEHTQAMVAVDVDRAQARGPNAAVNAAALDALASAIEVRELGGQIVVDFLEPDDEAQHRRLTAAIERMLLPLAVHLRACLGSGLTILERPQRRISLADRNDPTVDAAEALLREAVVRGNAVVAVAPDIDDLLRRETYARAAKRWLDRQGAVLRIERVASCPSGTFVFEERHA